MKKVFHECCGSYGRRHKNKCPKHGDPNGTKLENGTTITVEICRDYYDRFGHIMLTPQRQLFRFMLEQLEEKNS